MRNHSYYFMRYLSSESREWQHAPPQYPPLCEISGEEYIAFYERRYRERTRPRLPRPIEASMGAITDYDRRKALIPIRNTATGAQLDMMPENYVYVVRFRDRYTKRRYLFNLDELALRLAEFGVDYNTNKFAKITLHYRDGPSHLFFKSGRMLETGTYNAVIARKSLDHTLALLREFGHYENIEIGRRRCENIVAKGSLKFELCIQVLLHMYPWCTRKAEKFVGVIIRVRDLHNRRPLSIKKEEEDEDDNEDREPETIAVDETDEFEFLETENNDERYNQGFDYHVVPKLEKLDEQEIVNVNAEEEEKKRQTGLSNRLLSVMRNPEEMDEADLDEVEAPGGEKNVTVIVFEKGKIICAGCKTERSVLRSCAAVLPMLEACKKTPRNLALEKELKVQEFIQS